MIGVFAEWAAVTAAAALLAGALGLGVGALAGRRPAPALVVPVGFAALVVITQFARLAGVSGSVAAIAAVVLGLAGLLAARRQGPLPRPALWGVAAVAAVWLVHAGVIAASGQETFGGYTQLADPAIHLVGAATLPGGIDTGAGGAFSAFYDGYYRTGYPTGGAALLGTLDALLGRDPVTTIQPLIALAMAVLAASIWSLLGPLVPQRPLRALFSVLATMPVLTFGFVAQASLKEVLAMAFLATACAALPRPAERPGPRAGIAAGLAAAALVASIGPAAVVYLGPAALAGGLLFLLVGGLRPAVLAVAGVAACAVLASLPTLLEVGDYLQVSGGVLTNQSELGNLFGPTQPLLQWFGVWLGPDFRGPARREGLSELGGWTVGILALLGLVALALLLRRREAASRAVAPLAWLAALVIGTAFVVRTGSPWADAKGLAIAGPVMIAFAGAGAAWLWQRRATLPLALLGSVVVAGGIAGTAAYAAYDATPAPEARFAELGAVNERFAGRGPMLTGEFEEFDRYLLRDVPANFGADPFANQPGAFQFGVSSDTDAYDVSALNGAKLLLVRSGPAASRPPSNYARVWQGRFYEVWQRDADAPSPRLRLPLGTLADGGVEQPSCRVLRDFARGAEAGDELVAAVRVAPVSTSFAKLPLPVGWVPDGDGRSVHPYGRARFDVTLKAPKSGAVDVWLEGSFTRELTVRANDATATLPAGSLNPRGAATRLLTTDAGPDGTVRLQITRPGRRIAPGWGNVRALWGPVSVTPADPLGAATRLERLRPTQVRQLCERTLDWVELVPRG